MLAFGMTAVDQFLQKGGCADTGGGASGLNQVNGQIHIPLGHQQRFGCGEKRHFHAIDVASDMGDRGGHQHQVMLVQSPAQHSVVQGGREGVMAVANLFRVAGGA